MSLEQKKDKQLLKLQRKCWVKHQIAKELSRRNLLLRKANEKKEKLLDEIKSVVIKLKSYSREDANDFDDSLSMLLKLVEGADQGSSQQSNKSKRHSIIINEPGTSLLRKTAALDQETHFEATMSNQPSNIPPTKSIPLFEHFLVIGAPMESANSIATEQLPQLSSQSITSKFRKTIDGIFSPSFVGNLLPNNTEASRVPNSNSYFRFPRNSGNDLNSFDKECESVPISMKSLFSSPSNLFLSKSRSGRDIEVKDAQFTAEEFRAPVVDGVKDNFTVSTSTLSEENTLLKGDEDQSDISHGQGDPSRSFYDSSKSLQGFKNGLISGGNSMKANAGTTLTRLGGALFSKLNPTFSPTSNKQSTSTLQSPPDNFSERIEQQHSADNFQFSDNCSQVTLQETTEESLSPHDEPRVCSGSKVQEDVSKKHLHLRGKDLKSGTFVVSSNVLFRYPENADPPPQEVCDFCMPAGARLQYLPSKDEDSNIQEILFGNSHNKRSGRSFIFLLEDGTIQSSDSGEEAQFGRLYGICVVHPRLLRTNVVDHNKRLNAKMSSRQQETLERSTRESLSGQVPDGLQVDNNVEFESLVCYVFITRLPYFDFFFQMLYDIIALEKLRRIELTDSLMDVNFESSKDFYEYLPTKLLLTVLERISSITFDQPTVLLDKALKPLPTPISFSTSSLLKDDDFQSLLHDWCLPTMLSWLPTELLVWSLSLLLVECKVIVVAHEAGLLSSVVLGLLSLLKPFRWVAPVIPMLPTTLLEFVESPVPIFAGILIDPLDDEKITSTSLLSRCDNATTAVLDLNRKELNIRVADDESLASLCFVNASQLKEEIQHRLLSSVSSSSYRNVKEVSRPLYHPTDVQREDAREVQLIIQNSLQTLGESALEFYLKSRERKKKLAQKLQRLSFSSQLSNIAENEEEFYCSDSDSTNECGDDDESSAMNSSLPTSPKANSVGMDLRMFYDRIVQSESSNELRLEGGMDKQRKLPRGTFQLSSLHVLHNDNDASWRFFQRFCRAQLFDEFLRQNQIALEE